jgi:hypothetical protein
MHWLPGWPLVAGRWRRVLPPRLWAFTATRWRPRSPLSSLPGRCRAFCYSHAPLIIQATAMTSCSTTRHSARIRSPSGVDEGWWRSFATCERFATQDRRTCPPGFMISLSLAILPTGAERAVEDQCQGARRASRVTRRRRALDGDLSAWFNDGSPGGWQLLYGARLGCSRAAAAAASAPRSFVTPHMGMTS